MSSKKDVTKLVRWWAMFLMGLSPFLYLVFLILTRGLGPDPGEAITRFNGLWSLIILLVCLSVTPLNRLLKWRWLAQHRRMIGLYAWFYAVLHVVSGFLLVLDVSFLLEEVVKRPYVTVGMVAFILMTALAVTSPKAMVRKLGKRWKSLHKSIYLIGVLAVIHYFWLTRADYSEPVFYSAVLTLLLGIRLYWARSKVKSANSQTASLRLS
ncbi:sulfoxide reductase heme-binding subunit YedZ [Hahella sp. CCB-MM4]|uniref:sulfite oxidase heme-binding subunit YedZ n=1 Tax=Hahella sp. (strain CCB-MM4) TaxID=1926491 RepID=UPI000B9C0BAC|nr:protein-methionine-sulfoxide reductase heme-binding subunit MsrQ [Hahella sp. CCB-MM4]OZG71492.1 sulfoxide reductase heme-binding subunit YedZ [Hahella sp. CCB-MM4]